MLNIKKVLDTQYDLASHIRSFSDKIKKKRDN